MKISFFNCKKHHSNKYITLTPNENLIFLTIKSIIVINTYILTPNENLVFLTIKSIRVINEYALTPNENLIF